MDSLMFWLFGQYWRKHKCPAGKLLTFPEHLDKNIPLLLKIKFWIQMNVFSKFSLSICTTKEIIVSGLDTFSNLISYINVFGIVAASPASVLLWDIQLVASEDSDRSPSNAHQRRRRPLRKPIVTVSTDSPVNSRVEKKLKVRFNLPWLETLYQLFGSFIPPGG